MIGIAVMGPTAVGKTEVAEQLALRFGTRVLNADAFQIYRRLEIGTAKPKNKNLYDLIDIREPWQSFSVGAFVRLAKPLCIERTKRREACVVCGGTGLYVRALFEDYQGMTPSSAQVRGELKARLILEGPKGLLKAEGQEVDDETAKNPLRLLRVLEKRRFKKSAQIEPGHVWPARKLKVGLFLERPILLERLEKRLYAMVQNGWLDEVNALLASGATPDWPAFRAIGYREMISCARGEMSLEETIDTILRRTRQYSKRQMTWLRKEPNLHWLDAAAGTTELVESIYKLIGDDNG